MAEPVYLLDRVVDRTTTIGPGTVTLLGPDAVKTTYRGFATAGVSGRRYWLMIEKDPEAANTAWEISEGVLTKGVSDTLSRTLVASSTGSLLSLDGSTYTIRCPTAAEMFDRLPRAKINEIFCGTVSSDPTTPSSTGVFFNKFVGSKPLPFYKEPNNGNSYALTFQWIRAIYSTAEAHASSAFVASSLQGTFTPYRSGNFWVGVETNYRLVEAAGSVVHGELQIYDATNDASLAKRTLKHSAGGVSDIERVQSAFFGAKWTGLTLGATYTLQLRSRLVTGDTITVHASNFPSQLWAFELLE